MTELSALALVCTLKKNPEPSSSELLASQVLDELNQHGVHGDSIRLVDHDVRFGVSTDEGDGDEWPSIRDRVLEADIVVVAAPTWVGQLASPGQMLLERLDAELSETDDEGRPSMYGKVAVVAVVGNEDGAHHVSAQLMQALGDIGFTFAAQPATYWNDVAMGSRDYKDLPETPEAVASATKAAASNAAHLARLLKDADYPT